MTDGECLLVHCEAVTGWDTGTVLFLIVATAVLVWSWCRHGR